MGVLSETENAQLRLAQEISEAEQAKAAEVERATQEHQRQMSEIVKLAKYPGAVTVIKGLNELRRELNKLDRGLKDYEPKRNPDLVHGIVDPKTDPNIIRPEGKDYYIDDEIRGHFPYGLWSLRWKDIRNSFAPENRNLPVGDHIGGRFGIEVRLTLDEILRINDRKIPVSADENEINILLAMAYLKPERPANEGLREKRIRNPMRNGIPQFRVR